MATPQTARRKIVVAIVWAVATLCGVILIRIGLERLFQDAGFVRDPDSGIWMRRGSLWTSLGSLTGLFVGLVAGIRSRGLLGWVLGPTLGMAVVVLDYYTVRWLVSCGVPAATALLVPTTGLVAGWILGLAHPLSRRAWVMLGALVAADAAGRWSCPLYLGYLGNERQVQFGSGTTWTHYLDWAIAAGPIAVAVAIAAGRRAQEPGVTKATGRRGRLSWWGLGLALGVAISGLWGVDRYQRARNVPVAESRVEGLPSNAREPTMARACGMLDRAMERHRLRPQPQGSPSGRDFRDFLRAYDPQRRFGYLFSPHPVGHMHTVQVGEVPGSAGKPMPVRVLVEPWVHDGSMVLWLTEADGSRWSDITSAERDQFYTMRLTPDPFKSREVVIGRKQFRQVAQASELERVVASFVSAIARRDAGDPVPVGDDPEPHLVDLLRRWGPCPQSDREPWQKVRSISTGERSLVRVHVDDDGLAQVLVSTRRVDIPLTCRISSAGDPTPTVAEPVEMLWLGKEGRIIGDSHEWPPDGEPLVEFRFEVLSRWVEIRSKGISMFRLDLGPAAQRIAKRRKEERR